MMSSTDVYVCPCDLLCASAFVSISSLLAVVFDPLDTHPFLYFILFPNSTDSRLLPLLLRFSFFFVFTLFLLFIQFLEQCGTKGELTSYCGTA